ncbi:AAC(3) family N-acetyltransferase [Campylobacter molothri]|uniref:AAC(3) family N-acetyltransferase n=1 Tax=Campylobacter molothri TaxID=1032242 RepID=UPI00301D1535|nr:aminoglycoside N(3)-acetyltransferase [Campylobacter sp. RM17709]
MKYILEYNCKKYSDIDLIETFYQLGIKNGDILCVHVQLFKFGKPLLPRNEFLQTILECFFEAIGKDGTLIMPTFTYNFCKNKIYDKQESKSEVGILTEYFRKLKNVQRTNDPIFSFAIKGSNQKIFLKNTTSCFGKNSIYDILVKKNGKYMIFGSNEGHALVHYVEEKNKTFCRYFKNFKGLIVDKHNKKNININYYVRDLKLSYACDIYKIRNIVNKIKSYSKKEFAGDTIEIYNSKEYVQAINQKLTNDKLAIYKKF